MRYFLDTEFSELGPHKPIDLISIGLVAEDGREFYAVSSEWCWSNVSDWVRENIIPYIKGVPRQTLAEIKESLLSFIGADKPEFWGYYADYDWVVFCQIFEAMVDLPPGWPMYCHDLKQWCDQLGNPKLSVQSATKHNALNDARWNKSVWELLSAWEKGVR